MHDDEQGFAKANKIFPEETLEETVNRIRIVRDELVSKYEKSEKRVLHLVATHAAIVKALSILHGADESCEWCFFCAFTGLEIKGKEYRMIYDEDSSHVKARL